MFTDYTIPAEVTADGRLELDDREQFSRAMRTFRPGRVTVRVEVDRGKRSDRANRYYRLILGLISDHTGSEVDELHEYFKAKFIEPQIVKILGEEFELRTTVTKSDRFTAYVDRIRRFALVDLGVDTPDPDPALRGKSRHAKRTEAA